MFSKDHNRTIKQLRRFKVNIFDLSYEKDSINIVTNYDDYKKIKKYYRVSIIKFLGINEIITNVKQNKYSLLMLSVFLLLLFFYTRIIISIDILTNNNELYDLVLNELDRRNITLYSFSKNDKVLNGIKEQIMKDNSDKLEWLNIKRIGMKYVINLEPKISKTYIDEKDYCNVVSTKDAMITKIYSSKGVELKEVNESVKKGEILISGDIKKDEELKKNVCADGVVYGNTWYTVNIEVPKTYDSYELLEKNRFNLLFKYNNKIWPLFKSQFDTYKVKDKEIVSLFGLDIYLRKEFKSRVITRKYNDNELNKKIDELIDEKMKITMSGDSRIKYKKVLKKVDNNSTIYLEVFIVAEEEIGERVIASKLEENE